MRDLPRNVHLLYASQGLMDVGMMGIAGVIENIFLLRPGFGAEFIGLAWAASMLGMVVTSVPAGEIGSRITMRRAMLIGMSLSALLYCAYSLAWLLPAEMRGGWILAVSLLKGASFSLIMVNCTPLLMGSCAPGESTHAFSVLSALATASAFVGALLGGLLPGLFARLLGEGAGDAAPYGLSLLVGAALFVPGALLLLLTREPSAGGEPARQASEEPATSFGATPPAAEPSADGRPMMLIAIMSVVALLCWLGQGTLIVFWNLYLDEALSVPTSLIGTLSAISHLVVIPAALITPLLARRLGNPRAYAVSILATAACMLPLAWATGWLAAGAGFIIATAMLAVAMPAISVTQQSLVSPRWRGRMSGATSTSATLGLGIAALGGGYAVASIGFRPLFLASAAIILASVVIFWAWFSRRAKEPAVGEIPRQSLDALEGDAGGAG